MIIYGDIYSGNCYKIILVLTELGIAHEWRHIDILAGESRSADFLKLNPNGRIPVLCDDDGRVLFESNAILNFLAHDSELLPQEAYARAQVLQWQFFEQYSHEPYIATSRFIMRYLNSPPERAAELEAKRLGGYAALDVMEQHLSEHEYFVAEKFSLADISLFAYTHVAHEGGFDLSRYANVRRWIDQITARPAYQSMDGYLGNE